MSRWEVDEFLAEPGRLVRIGTVDVDRQPLVSPAWFLHRDDVVFVTPRARSTWLANIEANPKVCLTFDEDAATYRRVTIRGQARVLYRPGRDNEWRDVYRAIALRYWDEPSVDEYMARTGHLSRALVALAVPGGAPEMTSWRAPRSDEDYSGIWAARYWKPLG